MEPDAYKKLEDLQLPHPRYWQPDAADTIPVDVEWIYARAIGQHALKGIHRRTDVLQWPSSETRQPADGIFQFDEVIDFVAGCAAVRRDQTIYAEFVLGHLSALLVDGLLVGRAALRRAQGSGLELLSSRIYDQPQLVRRRQGKLIRDSRSDSIDSAIEEFHKYLTLMEPWLRKVPDRQLVEVLIERNGHVKFVDLKSYRWNLRFDRLVGGVNPLVYGSNPRADPVFDGDLSDLVTDITSTYPTIRLHGRAALCHLVTYSLAQGLQNLVR